MGKTLSPSGPVDPMATRHVFLDTQVYRNFGHNPRNPLFGELTAHIEAGRIVLHITDITLAEIERQIDDFIDEADKAVAAARRSMGIWKKRLPDALPYELPRFDRDGLARKARDQFRSICMGEWAATLHSATSVPARRVFASYFARQAPFAKVGSKEFPDAFVVEALDTWCSENEERMYVVGADAAMAAAAERTDTLLPMATLQYVLEALAKTQSPDIVHEAWELLRKQEVGDALQMQVGARIDELIPIYTGTDLAEGEVTGHSLVRPIGLVDVTVLSVSSEEIGALLDVRTPLLIELDYEEREFAVYDREEGRYFGAERSEAELEREPVVRVFARIRRHPAGVTGVRMLSGEFDVDDEAEFHT